jgi:hypothetical protein
MNQLPAANSSDDSLKSSRKPLEELVNHRPVPRLQSADESRRPTAHAGVLPPPAPNCDRGVIQWGLND